METLQEPTQFGLRTSDQLWMAKFGASANWQDDPFLLDKLQALVVLGSQRINDSDNELQHHEIVDAREQFFKFVGIQPTVIEALRKVSTDLTPIDTFIGTQRVMYDLGLDAVKIINGCPSAISYGPQSVREKVTNLTDLGLDAIKIINGFPSAISYAPQSVREKVLNLTDLGLGAVKIINRLPSVIGLSIESVREKVTNLTDLGLDAVKIINGFPSALGFALESVREKVTNLTDLGLDAVKIINSCPSALGCAVESVREKVTNLTDLGLDAVKIINGCPIAIGYAPQSVRNKVRFLEITVKALKWKYSSKELIEAYPGILGFSIKKLLILSRIAGMQLSTDARSIKPTTLKNNLITPLENYLLAIPQPEPSETNNVKLIARAKKLKLNAGERKKQALNLALTGQLGRVGVMYLDYANYSPA